MLLYVPTQRRHSNRSVATLETISAHTISCIESIGTTPPHPTPPHPTPPRTPPHPTPDYPNPLPEAAIPLPPSRAYGNVPSCPRHRSHTEMCPDLRPAVSACAGAHDEFAACGGGGFPRPCHPPGCQHHVQKSGQERLVPSRWEIYHNILNIRQRLPA